MSILVALSFLSAAQAAEASKENSLFARFVEIAVPYVQCVQNKGGREDLITPAHGSNVSWSEARSSYQRQYQADDTACGFYATHEKLTNIVGNRYPDIPKRNIGFIVNDAIGDLKRTGFRLESIDRFSRNGLPVAPPAPRLPGWKPPGSDK